MLLNRIRPVIDPILRKNQNGFRTNRSTSGKILIIRRILEGVKAKKLPTTLLFIDFAKAFDSIDRLKMENILIIYGIPKDIVNAIMMLYRSDHLTDILLILKLRPVSYNEIHWLRIYS